MPCGKTLDDHPASGARILQVIVNSNHLLILHLLLAEFIFMGFLLVPLCHLELQQFICANEEGV